MIGQEPGRNVENRRGQAPLVGVVLLIGLTSIAVVGVLLVGSSAMSEIQGSVEVQNAEHAMREADARLSQVAFSANDAHTLDFSGQGEVQVTHDGTMTITMVNGSNQPCRQTVPFGSIEYRSSDGEVVAYQAGGVWKRTGNGSTMISPPDMQYRNGTFSFQLVNVTGSVEGRVQKLQASKNASASRSDSQGFREAFGAARCNPPDNVTVTVESGYYRAWGEFFRSHIDDGDVTVDEENGTASLHVILSGTATQNGNSSLQVDREAKVSTELLSTEISYTESKWTQVDCDSYYCNVDYKVNSPVNIRVNVGNETYQPWGDVSGAGTVLEKDVNDPTDGGEYRSFSTNASVGDSISVEATAYGADSYNTSAYRELQLNGGTWRSGRTDDAGYEMADIEVDSEGKGQNEGNVVLLADGMEVPSYGSANREQRNMSQVLGDRMNETGHLQLEPNEFVVVYELSCTGATPDDVDNPNKCGSGDPDYNDAVVLVTIEEDGSVASPENFRIHVTVNQVRIEKKSG